jgi:hypothetical protein
MTNLSKIALVAALAMAGLASQAFAQSFDPEAGTGNVLGFSYTQPAPQAQRVAASTTRHGAVAARQRGANAFAMVPATAAGGAYDPAATGGGSVGYNQNVRNEW